MWRVAMEKSFPRVVAVSAAPNAYPAIRQIKYTDKY